MVSEQNEDELGTAAGPQAAAREALDVEIDGHEEPAGEGAAQPGGADDAEEWRDLLETGFRGLFSLLATRYRSFETSDEEITLLARTWTPVCQKHAGAALPVELVAGVATLAILAPKIAGAQMEAKKRKAGSEAEQQHRDPTTTYVGG